MQLHLASPLQDRAMLRWFRGYYHVLGELWGEPTDHHPASAADQILCVLRASSLNWHTAHQVFTATCRTSSESTIPPSWSATSSRSPSSLCDSPAEREYGETCQGTPGTCRLRVCTEPKPIPQFKPWWINKVQIHPGLKSLAICQYGNKNVEGRR